MEPIRARLDADADTLLATVPAAASREAAVSGLDPSWVERLLRDQLPDLGTMLAPTAHDRILWLIED